MFIRRTAVFACLFSCNMEVTARRNSLKGLRLVASENQDFKREAAGQEYCFPLKAILCCFFVSCPVVKARVCSSKLAFFSTRLIISSCVQPVVTFLSLFGFKKFPVLAL